MAFNRILSQESGLSVRSKLNYSGRYVEDLTNTTNYSVTLDDFASPSSSGIWIMLRIANAPAGSPTLQINGDAAKAIFARNGNAASAADMPAGAICTLVLDNANNRWQLLENSSVVDLSDYILKEIYDPNDVADDVYDRDNHVDGSTAVAYSPTEKSKLAGIEDAATRDQTNAEIRAAYENEREVLPDPVITNGTSGPEADTIYTVTIRQLIKVAQQYGGGGGGGDMLQSVYDPGGVGSDAFDMANMSESAANKILTSSERSAIATNSAKVSADGSVTSHNDVTDAGSGAIMSASERSKLGGIEANANNYSHPNHSGDVVSIGDGSTAIQNQVVTNPKLANMAQATIKGRASGAGGGAPQDLTGAQVRAAIGITDLGSGNITTTAERSLWNGYDARISALGAWAVVEVSGASFEVTNTHKSSVLIFTNAAGCAVTFNASLDADFRCEAIRDTVGSVDFSDANLKTDTGTSIATNRQAVSIRKGLNNDIWIFGNLV